MPQRADKNETTADREPTDAATAAADGADAPDDDPTFQNRAERRGKGKKDASQPAWAGNSPRLQSRGGFQSPRQYGNRRSG